MELFEGTTGMWIKRSIFVALVLLAAFLAVQVTAGVIGLRYVGAGVQPANTISVSGYGESFSAPDIATFSYSVVSNKATVEAAQTDATKKSNDITTYLKGAGVAAKDIQTSGYSISPQYEYQTASCAQGYCPPGKQILTGYEVRQTTTIKVRDTAKAGELLAGVGSRGATEASGLNFTFDNPTQGQDEARQKAIADAKGKADTLAKQLGVSLVRVVSFNENSGGYPSPMYARDLSVGVANETKAAVAPEISVGENQVSSNVSITYEIR